MKNHIIKYCIVSLQLYWNKKNNLIKNFLSKNYKNVNFKKIDTTPLTIKLDNTYQELNFKEIVIPKFFFKEKLEDIDWANCIYFLINQEIEKKFQNNVYGYLKNIDKKYDLYFYKAWVNRYAILIRKIISKKKNTKEKKFFGERPRGRIIITHDIDVTKLTLNFFLKQIIFILFNTLKCLLTFNFKGGFKFFKRIFFLLKELDYIKYIKQMIKIEKHIKCKKIFFINSSINRSKKIFSFNNLINPKYRLDELSFLKKRNMKNYFKIGLHQSVQTSDNYELMIKEKNHLEDFFLKKIEFCRQHWLKNIHNKTSKIQSKCNLKVDFTLGFNDHYGFRNSSCLKLKKNNIYQIPMILMDSHFYDYLNLDDYDIKEKIKTLIKEVYFVGGIASVNWHPHTLSETYGWKNGYLILINEIKKNEKNIRKKNRSSYS